MAPRSISYAASLVALGVLLSACSGEPVPADRQELVGKWEGPGVTLVITAEGHCDYVLVEGSRTSLNAPIKSWSDDGFVVGVGPISTTFVIDVAPHAKGDPPRWHVTVDGRELIRVYPP